jgi:hypothetical protein
LQDHGAAQPGNVLQNVGKGDVDKLGNGGKIVDLPGGLNKTDAPQNSKLNVDKLGGQIVTLPSSGIHASSGNNGTGKIVELPGAGLNKNAAQQNTKLNGELSHFEDRPVKPLQQFRINQQPTGASRSDIGAPPTIRQGLGMRNAGNNLHVASGPAFQSQARSGGMLMRR